MFDPVADLIGALVATDAVRVLDLKGHDGDTEVDNPADPALSERVLDAFPDAVIEAPGSRTTPATASTPKPTG